MCDALLTLVHPWLIYECRWYFAILRSSTRRGWVVHILHMWRMHGVLARIIILIAWNWCRLWKSVIDQIRHEQLNIVDFGRLDRKSSWSMFPMRMLALLDALTMMGNSATGSAGGGGFTFVPLSSMNNISSSTWSSSLFSTA